MNYNFDPGDIVVFHKMDHIMYMFECVQVRPQALLINFVLLSRPLPFSKLKSFFICKRAQEYHGILEYSLVRLHPKN